MIPGKEYIFTTDIYSIGMLMWEISSGQPPFASFDHNYDLAMKIINGMRPRIVPGTPLEYEKLMKQCWDADPLKRPNVYTLGDKIDNLNSYLNEKEQQQTNNNIDTQLNTNTSSGSINPLARMFSRIHIFDDLPEPRNATDGKL